MDENWVTEFLSHPEMEPNRTGHAKLPAGPPSGAGGTHPSRCARRTATASGSAGCTTA